MKLNQKLGLKRNKVKVNLKREGGASDVRTRVTDDEHEVKVSEG